MKFTLIIFIKVNLTMSEISGFERHQQLQETFHPHLYNIILEYLLPSKEEVKNNFTKCLDEIHTMVICKSCKYKDRDLYRQIFYNFSVYYCDDCYRKNVEENIDHNNSGYITYKNNPLVFVSNELSDITKINRYIPHDRELVCKNIIGYIIKNGFEYDEIFDIPYNKLQSYLNFDFSSNYIDIFEGEDRFYNKFKRYLNRHLLKYNTYD